MQPLPVNIAIANSREAETRLPLEPHPSKPAPIPASRERDGAGLRSQDVETFFADQNARAKDITERASSLSSDGDIPEFLRTESGSDVLGDWMTGEMSEETEEQKKKFLQLLATAKDPDSVLLAITQRHAQESLTKVGKLMTAYKDKMETLDHLQAGLDLHAAGGELTQADMMKTNMEFSRAQSDTMNLFQVIQKEMNNYENVMQSGQSMFKADNADDIMIQNMKG